VEQDTGRPPASARLLWRRVPSEGFKELKLQSTGYPDPDGRFEFTVPAGTIELLAVRAGQSSYLPSSVVVVSLPRGGRSEEGEFVLPRGFEAPLAYASGTGPLPPEVAVMLVESDLHDRLWLEGSHSTNWKGNWGELLPGVDFWSRRNVSRALRNGQPIGPLASGRYVFKVVPPIIDLQPSEIAVPSADGQPVQIEWSYR
jgi:hypothetical protein